MPRKPDPLNDFLDIEAGRNPRYASSVYLAFERGILRAPGSLINLTWWPLVTMLSGFAFLIVGLALWVLIRLHFVVFGLLGHLRPKSAQGSKSVLSSHR
ncbi:hypothetical protein [Methylobacterium oryzae]|uniref:hypothetical protein n=1 Tax=Methylobacterium oryzae TaxID=334852 RepID=UPI001F2A1B6B|nr:hypothetical protein [Methylobacterium oryzae]UIN38363.1 hypothetical protein LXM90_30745 [Methylobacterium oryzae]